MKKKNLVILLCLFAFCTAVKAQAQEHGKRITLTLNKVALPTALSKVEQQSEYYKINYSYDELSRYSVSESIKDMTAIEAVNALLNKLPYTATVDGKYIIIKKTTHSNNIASQQNQKGLSGRITDEGGEPLLGATVVVPGTQKMAVTDMDGSFFLPDVSPNDIVEISYIGKKTIRRKAGTRKMNVIISDDENLLENVVVTGYQQLDRRNLTSSIVSKDMSELEIAGVSDISKMLEGKIPDLVSLSGSGEINSTNKIRIRGTSTLVGNREPLWVLDGVILTDPINLSPDVLNDPDYINRIGNAIAGINPQDIQRIDVLKDAAATALYGTRAANGVIVVTTKTGHEGKPIVSYSGMFTARKRPYYSDEKINLMSSAERVELSQFLAEAHYAYPNSMSRVGYEEALRQLYAREITRDEFNLQVQEMSRQNTDWFDLLCQNSFSHDHSLSIAGGGDKVRYYTSLGYTEQEDVIKDTSNRRYTAMAKINYNITNKLKAELNVNGNVNNRDYSPLNIIDYAYNTNRVIPAYNADGSFFKYPRYNTYNSQYGYYGYNILNEIASSSNKQRSNAVITTASLRFQATEDLFFNGVFSANITDANTRKWYGENSFYVACLRGAEAGNDPPSSSYLPYGGELNESTHHTLGWTARLQGNYNKYLDHNKRNNINVAVGLEASSSHYTSRDDTNRCYFIDRGMTFATDVPETFNNYWTWMRRNTPTITDTKNNMVSAYATLSYSFEQKFTLNINGRYDGSNKFGSRSNEKLLPIWSVSGNANLLDIFNIRSPHIDVLTLKSSYGEQGNMLDNQTPNLIIKKGGIDAFLKEFTSETAYFANPDLKWEKTHSFNIGLETSLFNKRLQIETEYYHKRTTDAFMDKRISDINGFESYVVNSGIITNSGFNVSLTGTPIKLKDFYWIVSGNLSRIYNQIRTAPSAESYTLNDFLNGKAVVKGQAVGTFYSYRFAGLNPVDGGPLFEDWEERQQEISTADQYTFYTSILEPSGRREPNITGSINNTFTYKQWRLGTTFIFNFGAKTRLLRLFDGVSGGRQFSSETNANRDLKNRWMQPGDENITNIPAIICGGDPAYENYSNNWTTNTGYTGPVLSGNAWTMYDYSNVRVVDAGYVKLSTLTLTYEFMKKQLEKLKLGRLAFTLTGYNLHTWCNKKLRGQTPTQGGFTEVQLSDTPHFSFSINVNF